ncbi:cytochrome c oxidase polypeptide II [Gracilibacillus boraciitolerans JCM 21714]|uniref:Cytochrome c oxidase polypeptide II n=1 Tax=Gracilibacillus boraciitolerans JCM 21714 TaxID=1298598 RepID=W4VNC1_9BACI|nr:cytochrome c oxidase subunit II [Gracilibacillus boraciitolerans]GAE94249.1 cytochrome c oxidase polypeptide II [Gracilibacillus boraciitolerans JCM 21714]
MRVLKNVFFITTLISLLSACDIRVLNPKSDTASTQTDLIHFSFLIMLLVLITVFVLLFLFVRKYRDISGRHDQPVQTKGNKKLEWTWTIIPIVLLTILAVPTVIVTYSQSPNSEAHEKDTKDTVHIQVKAEQFSWSFVYDNGKVSQDELYLPSDKTIVFHLQSNDVIHSFWVPSLVEKSMFCHIKKTQWKSKG